MNKVTQFKVHPVNIMKELGKMIEDSKRLPDQEFWDDRLYWMKQNYDSDIDTYKSRKEEDKETVLDYDLETLNQLINQVLRFGRIVMSTDGGVVYNFPKGEIPKFIVDIKEPTNTIINNIRRQKIC